MSASHAPSLLSSVGSQMRILLTLWFGALLAASQPLMAQPGAKSESRIVAVLFGEPVSAGDIGLRDGEKPAASALKTRALKAALDRFVEDNRLAATPADFDAYARFETLSQRADRARRRQRLIELEAELVSPGLDPAARKSAEEYRDTLKRLERFDAERAAMKLKAEDKQRVWGPWIAGFKAGKALYERYGGVVGLTKFGPEPTGALAALLREHEQAGRLQIHDPRLRLAFWAEMDRLPRRIASPGEADFTYYWLKPLPRD